MASACALAMFSGKNIFISRLSRPAGRSKRYFHRWGRSREQQLFGEQTLSVRSRWSRPAPPKGELFAISRSVEQNLPLSGEVASRSDDGEGLPAPRSAALPQEAGAANAVDRYDPSRENAKPERPQTLRLCSIKNILSAIYAQSNAERI